MYSVTAVNGVNVRTEPNGRVVGAASKGVTFTVSSLSGDWGYSSSIQCTNGVKSGYVFLGNCQLISSVQTNYATITYNANGGYGGPGSQRVKKVQSFTFSKKAPKRDGYSFLGWGGKGATYVSICPGEIGYNLTKDITLYAVWAKGTVKAPGKDGYYYIQHISSGRYLDITNESNDNGARLQIWEKYPNHQNQVFFLQKDGIAWKIIPQNSHKVIEVRDSSEANGAQVAQWDDYNGACQKWFIVCNTDGSVSFKNYNSGKNMDVPNNENKNGIILGNENNCRIY